MTIGYRLTYFVVIINSQITSKKKSDKHILITIKS